LARNESVGRVLSELIKLTGYDESLGSLDPLEAQGRRENIAELVSAAQEFSERFVPEGGATCIEAWLAETSLVSEIDFHNPDQDCVTLMTLHNAKGLEFPVVFIAGVEQNLLPVGRALEDSRQAALEEERRLFYVGITRAQERLFLSWAASRRRYTEILDTGPSEFLDHIPERLVERRWSPHALRKKSYRGGGRGSFSFTGATLGQKGPIGAAPPVFVSVSGQGKGSLDGKAVSEPVFERDPGVDEPAWRKGERVVHNRFGSGTIIEVSSRLDDLKVRVSFDSGETKKLAARFARLRRE
ncbi:MAG: 3'-5' exonuclease, partial [Gemmatimonadota bacterium]|nr:3'-5' exonuclease [Gemmatimonadota bacterium]